jgi:hypothetical protein
MRLLNVVFFITVIAVSIVQTKKQFDTGYNQGKMDAQNECIVEQGISDQILLDMAIEDAKWQCSVKIEKVVKMCNEHYGH